MRYIILLSLVGVIVPLVIYSLGIEQRVRSDRDFFLGIEPLSVKELFSSLAASWLMLGNVFLACLILGRYYGWNNIWAVVTWLAAFFLMKRHVGAVTAALNQHSTLHSFLGDAYASPQLRRIAAIVTAATGIGIIALEIIVVMALLVPATGTTSPIVPLLGGLLILITLAAYSVLGGFSAVTRTDVYQLVAVICGLFAIAMLLFGLVVNGLTPLTMVRAVLGTTLSSTGTNVYWFYLGLFFLQVPLFLGDFGTWQRIKACEARAMDCQTPSAVEQPNDAKPELEQVPHAPMSVKSEEATFGYLGWTNALMWVILIGAGAFLGVIPSGVIPNYPDSYLYATAGPIVDLLNLTVVLGQRWGSLVGYALAMFITIGLVSAMMSTADSYLLIAMQAIHDDILLRPSGGADAMRFARKGSLAAVIVAFAIAVYVVLSKANFLPIVSLLFSLQATIAPITVWALYGRRVNEYSGAALVALVTGFIVCAGYGIWGTFSSSAGTFHKANVTFILPVIAFAIPFVFLSVKIVACEGPSGSSRLFWAFLGGKRQ
jgi:Na+/proline symporter